MSAEKPTQRTLGGEDADAGCPYGHGFCDRGSDADRPVYCFECWHEVAAYDEDELLEADTDPGGAALPLGSCDIDNCQNDAEDGSMNGLCGDHNEVRPLGGDAA